MTPFFSKMQAGGVCPPRASCRQIALASLGGCIAIAVVAWLANISHLPLVLGSFGATCVLVFGFPDVPFSQPRNVIGGHFLASLTGLLLFALLGSHWWSMALAVGVAIGIMQLTRTVHPPAGSNPLIVMLAAPSWDFLLTPTLLGATALVLIALVFNNLQTNQKYPKYWF